MLVQSLNIIYINAITHNIFSLSRHITQEYSADDTSDVQPRNNFSIPLRFFFLPSGLHGLKPSLNLKPLHLAMAMFFISEKNVKQFWNCLQNNQEVNVRLFSARKQFCFRAAQFVNRRHCLPACWQRTTLSLSHLILWQFSPVVHLVLPVAPRIREQRSIFDLFSTTCRTI